MSKDTRHEWRRGEVPRLSGSPFALFAVDDSEVLIHGSRHTILAAVAFREPATVVDRMADLRREMGLPAEFEFKWNTKVADGGIRIRISEAFRDILSSSIGLLIIKEGVHRQSAAEQLAQQIADLIEGPMVPFVIFDEEIVTDEHTFRGFLTSSGCDSLRRLQFSRATSQAHDLVQCADLFAGFHNLQIRLALGEATDREILSNDENVCVRLSFLLEATFRYTLWGQMVTTLAPGRSSLESPPPDWLFKETEGLGMRIVSSLDQETKRLLYEKVGRPYMGCLH